MMGKKKKKNKKKKRVRYHHYQPLRRTTAGEIRHLATDHLGGTYYCIGEHKREHGV